MEKLHIPAEDKPYIEALRGLIRTGITAAPNLEHLPLITLPVVTKASGPDATPIKRAHIFIEVLRTVIKHRLANREAETAAILFGIDTYAGLPVQDRYRAVARLYNPHWTWENFRKEPLTRHLLAVYLALKREAELSEQRPFATKHHAPRTIQMRHASTVLIVQNITREGPGLLEQLLQEMAISYNIVNLDRGDAFPDPTPYGALVVLGGPDSANDITPKMTNELRHIKTAFDAGIPYLGVCLGLQAAVKVMGGHVVPSPVKEIGLSTPEGVPYSVSLTNLALTALGKKDPLFLGLQNHFRVFQLHGETVELTANMQLLAIGQDCPNQIVKFRRNAYGIQSHFELTKAMLSEWLAADPDLSPLDAKKVLAEFNDIEDVYTITGLSLFRNFLHIAGLAT